MSEPIPVEAEIIETADEPTSELKIIEAKPGIPVKSNIALVKAWVDKQLELYDVPSIKTEDDFKQAKKDRTALRKMGENVEDDRKRVTDLYMAPVNAFRDQVKTITDPITKLDKLMKGAIDKYDKDQKEGKRQRIQEYYEDMAPDIALPLDGQDRALVPFERIFDESWLNRGTSDVEAQQDIDGKLSKLAEAEKSLDSLGLEHVSEAKATFWDTLDINAAINRNRELVEAEKRQRALDAERKAREEEQSAEIAQTPEPETVEATVYANPVPTPATGRLQARETPNEDPNHRWTLNLDFIATRGTAMQLRNAIKALGITGGTIKDEGVVNG